MSHPARSRALTACARNLFARARLSADGTVDSFSFGPPGALLLDNVLREWRLSCVLDAPHEMFPSSGEPCDVGQALADARTLNPSLPLGVAHSWVETVSTAPTRLPSDTPDGGATPGLVPALRTVVRASVLLPPDQADRALHAWMRHRVIWWRKLSSEPGRYETVRLPTKDSVAIRAMFAWGTESLETVSVEAADGTDRLRLLQAETSLELAAVAFLCDAMDGAHRATRLHRKLAPYKIAILATAEDAALTQLARFFCRQLREAGISCMLAPSNLPGQPVSEPVSEPGMERVSERLILHDALGIPFTLLLDSESLRSGLATLRSRDSTLQEQMHVTDLKAYVELLLKNY